MPPPSNENDLKRLARRRLIGAVALALLAVIVLPLLLEDEPPPASTLSVHMTTMPAPLREQTAAPAHDASLPEATPTPEPARAVTRPEPAPEPETVKPKPAKAEPVRAEPAKPQAKPAAASGMFVVQLAALSDGAKARELKARAALAGLPAYTDTVGNLTRVRVGPFPTREAAVAAAVRLAENGMGGQVLTK